MSGHSHTLPVVTADGAPRAGAQAPPSVPSGTLVGMLAGAGAFAGLLIVLVFGWAQPRIAAHQDVPVGRGLDSKSLEQQVGNARDALPPAAGGAMSDFVRIVEVGPRDGFHCDRDRLLCTNTVSGLPLRIDQIPDSCQPWSRAPAGPVRLLAKGSAQVKFMTQLCRVSKSDGPLL